MTSQTQGGRSIHLSYGELYATRNDPRPQMIPKFFHTRPEMIPRNYRNGMGWRLIPEDARITRIK